MISDNDRPPRNWYRWALDEIEANRTDPARREASAKAAGDAYRAFVIAAKKLYGIDIRMPRHFRNDS